MKLYHYTTLETLALILKSKTIRFNRLDRVDDLEEIAISKGVKLGQYVFVSCWTKDEEESVPLWKMYAGVENGVRIALDEDMFYVNTLIMMLQGMYMLSHNEDGKIVCWDIDYVDDVLKKTSSLYENEEQYLFVNFGEVGKYKNKRWAFQKECRFVLNKYPINIFETFLKNRENMRRVFEETFGNNVPPSDFYFDMYLKEDVLNHIEITLSPSMSEGNKILAEALCKQYTTHGKVFESALVGKVKLK